MTTKRQKLQAMADQTASPAEAEVAKAMLASSPDRLVAIADDIKSEWGKGIEAQFAIGRLLSEARGMFPADQDFGRWLRGQGFPFTYQTAWNLRIGAEREDEVRGYIALNAGGEQSRDIGVTTAVKELTAKPKQPSAEAEPVTDTTPVDPGYAAMRTAHRILVEEGGFANMHVEDMAKIAVFIKDIAGAYTDAKNARHA